MAKWCYYSSIFSCTSLSLPFSWFRWTSMHFLAVRRPSKNTVRKVATVRWTSLTSTSDSSWKTTKSLSRYVRYAMGSVEGNFPLLPIVKLENTTHKSLCIYCIEPTFYKWPLKQNSYCLDDCTLFILWTIEFLSVSEFTMYLLLITKSRNLLCDPAW